MVGSPQAFGDFDGDGFTDLLVFVDFDVYTLNEQWGVRVLSGRTGATLYEHRFGHVFSTGVFALGDVDGDGFQDFAYGFDSQSAATPNWLEIWSPHLDRVLWRAYGPFQGAFGYATIGNLDLDGDGFKDVVTTTSMRTDSRVFAYDHSGNLLYTIDLLQQYGWQIRGYPGGGIGAVGDIDGDGADDFGVGLIESSTRGGVALFSGRTGSLIRVDHGTQLLDAIGQQVVAMGDMDRDGVPDYAASNRIGARGVVTIFSGATGSVIREWSDTQGYFLAEKMLGGMDLDLDGVPDVFAGGPNYFNGYYGNGSYFGRVQALSGRDGGMLLDERNWFTPGGFNGSVTHLGEGLANLGPQPGSPYPVIVVFDWLPQLVGAFIYDRPRLRAIRVNLAGTAVSGSGCSSTGGAAPQIAVRQDPGSLRVTLSGAPAGSLAWLLAGTAATSSWNGSPLPVLLDPFGLYGCSLRVDPELIFPRAAGSSGLDAGYATVTAPLTVATTGFAVAAQWLVLDPATLGYAATPRHELRVQ